jgi:hypothetical protein
MPRVFPQVELKSQEAQGLQEQRDQCLAHLQQYVAAYQQHVAAYQQLTSEKEALHQQFLIQTQLLDQLKHEEVQGKMAAEMAHQELKETQEQLEATNQQNQQLQAQLSLLAVPKEGDGVGRVENDEATPQPHLTILEDIDSPEVMVAFLSATLAQDEEEKTQLQGQLKNQMAHCLCLAQLARLAPRSESNCVWGGGRVSRPYRYPWRSCRATSWRSNRRSWHHGNT